MYSKDIKKCFNKPMIELLKTLNKFVFINENILKAQIKKCLVLRRERFIFADYARRIILICSNSDVFNADNHLII